jgi:membrane-associated protein
MDFGILIGWIAFLIDFVLHVDRYLGQIIQAVGGWTYVILFAIIFLETGFVVTPFLPGDSLLFAAGALAGAGYLDPVALNVLLVIAASSGNTSNYWLGRFVGPRLIAMGKGRWIKQKHLDKTHSFFERYGGKTVVLARFVPIVRTFAPFVAGLGAMTYRRFAVFDIVGGVSWVTSFIWLGYFFGNLEFVRKNFSLVIFAIIIISVMPMVIEFLRAKYAKEAQ